nr:unnamed protein product [Spirometra erinaceieuropaei]
MSDYIESRYAEEVPVKDAGYSWYLPYHPVFHPTKPNKMRVVIDCATKFYGTFLNDQLLSGPDMTNSLIGILSGFRQKKVSIMADIESIFHQGRVSEKDRDVLRVPWWTNGDLSQPPKEYRMTEHLFEDTSSSSGATFALSRAITNGAESYEKNAPEEVKLNCDFQLHALSDASETAYGAVAYMVVGGKSETTSSRLIFSKVRIDPFRATILPRVELMAAVVAIKIARLIRTEMSVMISTTFHVTDSPVVLEEQRLTYEVIRTVITEIEQILNDRPLARQSDDPDDQLPMYCLQLILPLLILPKPSNPAAHLHHAIYILLFLITFFLERKPCGRPCSDAFSAFSATTRSDAAVKKRLDRSRSSTLAIWLLHRGFIRPSTAGTFQNLRVWDSFLPFTLMSRSTTAPPAPHPPARYIFPSGRTYSAALQ